jgi:hypothetical protein
MLISRKHYVLIAVAPHEEKYVIIMQQFFAIFDFCQIKNNRLRICGKQKLDRKPLDRKAT